VKKAKITIEEGGDYFAITVDIPEPAPLSKRYYFDQEEHVASKLIDIFESLGYKTEYEVDC